MWDEQYRNGQGRYFPNEELIRFLGRTYGPMPQRHATGMTALEIGCGVGGNVWALTQWGFFVYGLEMSQEAIKLANEHAKVQRFEHSKDYRPYTAPADIKLPARSVNLVVDVQTIQHLSEEAHHKIYRDIYRLLVPGGRFVCVHWSGEDSAVDAIFPAHKELKSRDFILSAMLMEVGFTVPYCEYVSKSYPHTNELAQWSIVEGVKL